jgi:2-polyprenyl-6-methoxyphenol hydroxylase-like FAD-dependent oxidoreductase
MAPSTQEVVIVGAGPAGMMLAYQLVSNGIRVRVLERHPDFKREFRGELVQRSVVDQLAKAGIFKLLVDRGLALPDVKRQMFLGATKKVQVPGPSDVGAIISQPGLLGLLHELCSKSPLYRMEFSTTVLDAIQTDGRVVGFKTRKEGTEGRVDAELFVVCTGRNTALRKACGLETTVFEQTADALWMRFDFSDAPQAMPGSVNVHMFGKGVVVVLQPSTGNRLHLAYSAPGDLSALKKDLPELKNRLLPFLNEEVRRLVDAKLSADTETQVLKIIVDRVSRWHAPGILFLGDAAHTMSPSGGQGLNVAFRDSFVAANHLVAAMQKGQSVDAALFQKIEDERLPEVAALQAGQTRAGQMVLKPLPVLHMMFFTLSVAMVLMAKKLKAGNGLVPPEPKYLTAVA